MKKDNGVGAAKVYKDGRIEAQTPRDANNVLTIDAPNNTQSTDNTQAATNNNTTATTDNNVSTQENNTQSTQSTQTNEAQTTTKALPETGGQSNSGLVTIIASVLLAAGSLLAFRRTSNSK